MEQILTLSKYFTSFRPDMCPTHRLLLNLGRITEGPEFAP